MGRVEGRSRLVALELGVRHLDYGEIAASSADRRLPKKIALFDEAGKSHAYFHLEFNPTDDSQPSLEVYIRSDVDVNEPALLPPSMTVHSAEEEHGPHVAGALWLMDVLNLQSYSMMKTIHGLAAVVKLVTPRVEYLAENLPKGTALADAAHQALEYLKGVRQ